MSAITNSPAFVPGLIIAAGIAAIFWNLWIVLYGLWQGEDGYYSHGWLVPAISGYIVYRWWPRIKSIPVKTGWVGVVPLVFFLLLAWIASVNDIHAFMAVALMGTLISTAWLIAGWRWALVLSPAVLYLSFALPLWTSLINDYTNPLQIYSTKVAYYLLKILGFDPIEMSTPTVITMGHYELNVGVPCSGLKLLLALCAFTVFFVLIARLRWWANLVMIAMVLPLALAINGLRIGLIGMVGELQNGTAAAQFHDYSGYITLIVCFFILFKFARLLGWKD